MIAYSNAAEIPPLLPEPITEKSKPKIKVITVAKKQITPIDLLLIFVFTIVLLLIFLLAPHISLATIKKTNQKSIK